MEQKKIERGRRVKVKGRKGTFTAVYPIINDGDEVGWWVWRERLNAVLIADITLVKT